MRFIERFAKAASQSPKKIALITEENQLTFEDLLHLLHACDLQLRVRGLRDGMTVLFNSDRKEFYMIFVMLASHRGLNVVFSSLDSALKADVSFDYYVTTQDTDKVTDAKKLIIEGDWFSALGTSPVPDYGNSKPPIASYTFVTSGSTGLPKFILQTEEMRLQNLDRHSVLPEFPTASTRFLSSLSVTMSWAMFGYVSTILAGGCAVILDENRDKLLQYIDLYRVNRVVFTPAVLSRIMDMDQADQYLKAVEIIRLGGAMTSPALLDRFSKIYSGTLTVGYGASEIGGITIMTHADYADKGADCIGRIFRDDIDVAFFDDNLDIIPNGTEGAVGFRSHTDKTERHYLTEQDSDAKAGFIKGYFLPGDIMRQEGEWLYLIGRTKNIINFSGNKISLEALQSIIEPLVPLGLVACVAAQDNMGLEQLIVFYDGPHEIRIEDVNYALNKKLGNISVHLIRKLAKLPLTPSGKLDIETLRKTITLPKPETE